MTLAIFDLDGTLIAGDSDHSWGQFLVEKNIVDAATYQAKNDYFYQEYLAGSLDILEYLSFSLAPLTQFSLPELAQLHDEFMVLKISPLLLSKAVDLVADHKERGHTTMIITATNEFVTAPIARLLGVEHLIAPVPEIKEQRYTGNIVGVPSFQEGKVTRLTEWLNKTGHTLAGSYFYSDSHNDLPLLELVDHPIAVDADDTLTDVAKQKGWPTISLRD
ncbi:HAD family hydrolase [Marinomonas agarivorans]|nr:HAD family hydrolase [Marinomonas agarivorans]